MGRLGRPRDDRFRDQKARDPGAYASLWRFLFEIDLTSTLVAQNRPVDDAWQHLVSDVRLVDVGTALESRTHRTGVDVVLEVEDPFCRWHEGRWRLAGDHRGASCTRTGGPADVALPVGALASAYLGDVSPTALGRAGRAGELGRGTLARASPAFGNETAPLVAALLPGAGPVGPGRPRHPVGSLRTRGIRRRLRRRTAVSSAWSGDGGTARTGQEAWARQ